MVEYEDAEVIDYTTNGQWDKRNLHEVLSEDMVDYIVGSIQPPVSIGSIDMAWWMGDTTKNFIVTQLIG